MSFRDLDIWIMVVSIYDIFIQQRKLNETIEGIGLVIGHEITHGFDDTGRQFDKDGNRIPWWPEETIKEFNQRKQCIIDQYSNYSVPSIHMNVYL